MNNHRFSLVEASLYTFGTLFVVLLFLSLLGFGEGPKCAHNNCDIEVSNSGDYCAVHKPFKISSSGNWNTSTGNSNNSVINSNSHNSSSSSNKKYNSSNSYDAGYDDVYMDDDYDWDRYWEDDDYARGVDDALEDMDDGDW